MSATGCNLSRGGNSKKIAGKWGDVGKGRKEHVQSRGVPEM